MPKRFLTREEQIGIEPSYLRCTIAQVCQWFSDRISDTEQSSPRYRALPEALLYGSAIPTIHLCFDDHGQPRVLSGYEYVVILQQFRCGLLPAEAGSSDGGSRLVWYSRPSDNPNSHAVLGNEDRNAFDQHICHVVRHTSLPSVLTFAAPLGTQGCRDIPAETSEATEMCARRVCDTLCADEFGREIRSLLQPMHAIVCRAYVPECAAMTPSLAWLYTTSLLCFACRNLRDDGVYIDPICDTVAVYESQRRQDLQCAVDAPSPLTKAAEILKKTGRRIHHVQHRSGEQFEYSRLVVLVSFLSARPMRYRQLFADTMAHMRHFLDTADFPPKCDSAGIHRQRILRTLHTFRNREQ